MRTVSLAVVGGAGVGGWRGGGDGGGGWVTWGCEVSAKHAPLASEFRGVNELKLTNENRLARAARTCGPFIQTCLQLLGTPKSRVASSQPKRTKAGLNHSANDDEIDGVRVSTAETCAPAAWLRHHGHRRRRRSCPGGSRRAFWLRRRTRRPPRRRRRCLRGGTCLRRRRGGTHARRRRHHRVP
eukprot:3893775-Prymnesium_polylepis.1